MRVLDGDDTDLALWLALTDAAAALRLQARQEHDDPRPTRHRKRRGTRG